jgi:hypothetical protein
LIRTQARNELQVANGNEEGYEHAKQYLLRLQIVCFRAHQETCNIHLQFIDEVGSDKEEHHVGKDASSKDHDFHHQPDLELPKASCHDRALSIIIEEKVANEGDVDNL